MNRDDMMSRLDNFIGIESDNTYEAEYTESDFEDEQGEIYEAEVVSEAPGLEVLEAKASHDMDARIDSIVNTIQKAEQLLDNLTAVINERDEARDYEVAATMVNAIVNANKTVMDIHRDTIKLKKGTGNKQISIGTLNAQQTANVTVSSTKDIMKQLKELKSGL